MIQFSHDVEIDATPSRIWPIMSDVERWHEWTASIRGIKRWGDGPLSVGQRALVRQPKFPPAVWTVTAVDTERSFTWESVGPGIHVTGRHSIEPTARGSRVTLSLTYDGVFGRLLGRWTSGITIRYIAMEATGLKRRSENQS
jgi:Polyketide cyclase / dehydrase and lipid transport